MSKRGCSRTVFWLALLFLSGLLLGDPATTGAPQFTCGDADDNNKGPDIGDVTCLVNYLYLEGPAPAMPAAADCNGDSHIDIGDLTVLIAFLYISGPAPSCYEITHEDVAGPCLDGSPISVPPQGSLAGAPDTGGCAYFELPEGDSSYMYAELIGNDLHVYHINALYQCCLGYRVDFEREGFHITAVESDTSEECDCMCYFNLESVLYNLEVMHPAEFVVTLIGVYGDTVGVDTVASGGDSYMYCEAIGNDIHTHHMNAFCNCCLDYYVEYKIEGNSITASEFDVGQPCYCMCYFNLETILYGLREGEYIVTLIGVPGYPMEGDTIGVDTVIIGGAD